MIDKKFTFPNGLDVNDAVIVGKLNKELGKILETEIAVSTLRPRIGGNNTVTYIVRRNHTRVSVWCDPDSVKLQREGITIYINSASHEEAVYKSILDVFGIKE